MRILVVITKGEAGGAQTHLLELCRALAASHRFLVLIGGAESTPLGNALRASGIEVRAIATLGNSLSPTGALRTVARICDAVQSWAPDVVHLHSGGAGALGRIAAGLCGVPAVYTVHGFGFKDAVPPPRRQLALAVERLLSPLTRHMICVSHHERSLARRLPIPSGRVTVIANGIADSPLRAKPYAARGAVVMVARMAPPKRHDILLAALCVLRSRGLELPPVVLAGGGPGLPALRDMANDLGLGSLVELPGDLADVPALLVRSQVFVLLSDHEGLPISVIEALRAGLPVLASDLPGIRTQLDDGHEGWLTRNNPTEVADALQRLLTNPQMRERMGAAARARYERDFGARAMAARVEAIYQELARLPGSGRTYAP
ncbi:glycosyltransferase family 4 protein [Ramlibacter rhizophilus]|uniref:glycosyltransferase family 4 protein n=1 Tax=Ramlibacter rhizophilus TaxID=1781167 RepID=UPI00143276DC|nr:glycosyltransferase family 4 protein [Ramlibacter rhizophilus]